MHPAHIGRFEIRSPIGENERGEVFQAYDPQLQRDVAIKLLKSHFLYTLTSERKFQEEVQKLHALNHPAIVPIYDFGDEDNRPFIAMALMEGGNLTSKLASGPMSIQEVVELFTPIAEALDFAADRGIIHLDLKPNNILFDQHGHPFLGDLGLVQVIDELSAAKPPDVNPHYTNPEQVRKRDMDSRSHVYSLGALLYHALTGQTLFQGATEMVTMFKHVSEEPKHPRQLRPDLPLPVGEALLKAVEKRPEERYQTVTAFLRALDTAAGGVIPPEQIQKEKEQATPQWEEPTLEAYRPPSVEHLDPVASSPSRSRRGIILGLIIGAVLIVGCIGAGIAAFSFALSQEVSTDVGSPETRETHTTLAEENDFFLVTSEAATQQALSSATAEVAATEQAIAATSTQEALDAEIIQATRSAPQDAGWTVLVSDSFDENANDWYDTEESDEYADISWEINGKYIWSATAKQGFVWRVWPDLDEPENFYLSVDARLVSGPEDAEYGVILRNDVETNDYYYFEVVNSGSFAFFAHYNNEWVTLIDFTDTPAILRYETNRLEVIADGNQFLLFINGQFVGETFDNRLTSGDTGLAIGLSNDGEQAVYEFDNFEVRVPGDP